MFFQVKKQSEKYFKKQVIRQKYNSRTSKKKKNSTLEVMKTCSRSRQCTHYQYATDYKARVVGTEDYKT
jgi:NH3-dependent NAD+ synthetase